MPLFIVTDSLWQQPYTSMLLITILRECSSFVLQFNSHTSFQLLIELSQIILYSNNQCNACQLMSIQFSSCRPNNLIQLADLPKKSTCSRHLRRWIFNPFYLKDQFGMLSSHHLVQLLIFSVEIGFKVKENVYYSMKLWLSLSLRVVCSYSTLLTTRQD